MERRSRLEAVGPYKIGKAIGQGNFAVVRLAKHNIAKIKVAIKIIDKTCVNEENLQKIEREISVLKTLYHPNIIKLYEILRSERYIYIVTEYCAGGELYEFLTERGKVSESEARRIFSEIVSAIDYLHENGIVHRDLKAENILLDKNKKTIKIIDFGFSNYQSNDALLNTWCGSPPYAAPELLLGKEYDGTKADVWSLGVLLYILVTGGFPFPGDSVDKLKRAVLSGQVKIPFWVSVECADLIRKMLVLNPLKRYSVKQILSHRWMSTPISPRPSSASAMLSKELFFSSHHSRAAPNHGLDTAIMHYMQQHGKWSQEQIAEEVSRKDFESGIYATYELLCDKVRVSANDASTNRHEEYERRGSRGSILSGKANVEDQKTITISAHQLAQLGLSASPDCDSDDSSNSELYDDSPTGSMRNDKTKGIGLAINNEQTYRGEQRRHTLCANENLFSPEVLAQIPITSPLHQAFINQQQALAALTLHQQQQQQQPVAGPSHQPPTQMPTWWPTQIHGLPGLSTTATTDYMKIIPVPNNERRASAGETLLNQSTIEHLQQLVLQQQQQQPSDTNNDANVEEEGQGYLNKFGGKRNTVHGMSSTIPPANSVPRHTPYTKQNSGERRSSWASATATTIQQKTQLERLYKQALQNDPILFIPELQKEFQELFNGVTTNRGSNPQFDPSAMSRFGCPRISITDEHNRQRSLAPSSSSYDPVSNFEKKATEVVYGQRPATVIGFSNSSVSGTSTPEQQIRNNGDEKVKSLISTLPFTDVVDELKNSLNQLKIPFEESNEVVYMEHEMRRLSLPTGVEIGVAVLPPEQKSHVEFAILSSDSPTSEFICDELINRLRIIDPNSVTE